MTYLIQVCTANIKAFSKCMEQAEEGFTESCQADLALYVRYLSAAAV